MADQAEPRNFVAQDMIWKTHIKKELESAKNWPKDWGFLSARPDQMEPEKGGEKKKLRLNVPEHLQVRPTTPLEAYTKVDPSPAIPQTTQGLVGWRSTIPSLQLERYGKSRYLKGDFCKRMNWPAEGVA